jgi:hypothetical protein
MRFDAFPAREYNEVFSGYQPGKVVQFCINQRFEDHFCPRPQGRCLRNVGFYKTETPNPADSPRKLHYMK